MDNQQYIRVEEAAQLLGVSGATVRNWLKAGKLAAYKEGRSPLFDRRIVAELRTELFAANSQRLKQRRNKAAAEGNLIPAEYVKSMGLVELARTVVQLVGEENAAVRSEAVLAEIALRLLADRGHIAAKETDLRAGGILAAVHAGKITLGAYGNPISALFDFRKDGPSPVEQSVMRRLLKTPVRYMEGEDLLGLLYMSLSNLRTRKPQGSYYTPSKLVEALVESSLKLLADHPLPAVIDPCCGSGNFLIHTYLSLKAKLLQAGTAVEDAERILRTRCMTGYDIDPVAVSLAKVNMSLLAGRTEDESSLDFRIVQQNSLASAETASEKFDLVIGNPPWGYKFNHEEIAALRKAYFSAGSSVESFALFMESGVNMLGEGGLLAFLLPEAVLHVHLHRPIRRLLLERTSIERIELLGTPFSRVYAPAVTLTVRKTAPDAAHAVKVLAGEEAYEVAQTRFAENEQSVFNVQATDREHDLLERMKTLKGAMFLGGHAEFALGIVTGNNGLYVQAEKPEGGEVVLKGNNLYKYNYNPGNSYLLFTPDKFQQVAPEQTYRAKEKLLYRFVSEQLVFAYDDSRRLSLNSANLLIPKLPGYSVKYVMAVLNSRPIQYFYSHSYQSVKVLRGYIESLPIPPCGLEQQEEIVRLTDALRRQKKLASRLALYEQIDEIIMDLFCLLPEHKALIRKKLPAVKFLSVR
ncbi:TaqI-like C-terminal specificity domain-containing protein [Paenibacillus sp. MBLB4367]|uniref:TaqI-like C-terminal specificity domain-containing protein n=1 Tax=Paenibacillus sp. MBLB4367 TaxID=3384767 RepID=UPI003907EFCE